MIRQKFDPEIRTLLVRYYNTVNNYRLNSSIAESRMKKYQLVLKEYSYESIKATAFVMSQNPNRNSVFRLWLELIVLTGEV